jgi:hypothetical protein
LDWVEARFELFVPARFRILETLMLKARRETTNQTARLRQAVVAAAVAKLYWRPQHPSTRRERSTCLAGVEALGTVPTLADMAEEAA